MTKRTPSLAVLAMIALFGAAAEAAPTKVWVANNGVDSPSCGDVTAPCRTFQQAHNIVAAGGEIGVLTPGDYGKVSISKSVNITNDGTGEAAILLGNQVGLPGAGTGVFVDADKGDVVSLRGLVIDGQGVGDFGVQVVRASAVHIQNCVIRNFEAGSGAGSGVFLQPLVPVQVFVSDSIIFNNGSGSATGGILVQPQTTGSANVVLDRVHLENNVVGLLVDGSHGSAPVGSYVALRDSVVSGNTSDGILATTVAGLAPSFIVVERSSAVNNHSTGIHADGLRGTILVKESTIARNFIGVSATNSGQVITYGTNTNNNNIGPDGAATGNLSAF